MTYIRPNQYLTLEKGRYKLKVLSCEESYTQTNRLVWKCKFQILEGPSFIGRAFPSNIFEHQIAQVAQACGYEKEETPDGDEAYNLHPMDLVRRCFLVTVIPKESNGKIYNNFHKDWEEIKIDSKDGDAPF